ncbi:MAG TPA: hypothetical protein ENK16_06365, partial [Chromatiales bacterium]|nr:hypothetical protein [Chromatiales bacterium]
MNWHGMVMYMNPICRRCSWLAAIVALVLASGAWSADDDNGKTAYRKETADTGWNATAKSEPPDKPVQSGKSAFTVRVY